IFNPSVKINRPNSVQNVLNFIGSQCAVKPSGFRERCAASGSVSKPIFEVWSYKRMFIDRFYHGKLRPRNNSVSRSLPRIFENEDDTWNVSSRGLSYIQSCPVPNSGAFRKYVSP